MAVAGICQAQSFGSAGPYYYQRDGLVVNPLGELTEALLVMDRSGEERMVPLERVRLAEEQKR